MAAYNFVCLVGKDVKIITDNSGEYMGKVKQVFDDYVVLYDEEDFIIKRTRIISVQIIGPTTVTAE